MEQAKSAQVRHERAKNRAAQKMSSSLLEEDMEVGEVDFSQSFDVSYNRSLLFSAEKGVQTDPESLKNSELVKLRQMVRKLHKELALSQKREDDLKKKVQEQQFCYKNISVNEEKLKFFTGLPNKDVFTWLLELLGDKEKVICKRLSIEDHLLLVLMKLRLGLQHKDLAYRFGVTTSVTGRIYKSWIKVLSESLMKGL